MNYTNNVLNLATALNSEKVRKREKTEVKRRRFDLAYFKKVKNRLNIAYGNFFVDSISKVAKKVEEF